MGACMYGPEGTRAKIRLRKLLPLGGYGGEGCRCVTGMYSKALFLQYTFLFSVNLLHTAIASGAHLFQVSNKFLFYSI